ncbi:2-oxoacid:acceptor oxidoreductase family protein [Bdellovibrionota bacterium]
MSSAKNKFPFPGVPTTTDGSSAVAWVETNACTGGGAYPITPASAMGVMFEQAVSNGKKNVWGETLVFMEPESEHSAASVCEGYAAAGGRVSNFTASQGLVLMKEVLYTIAGKRLPVVFHISARAITVQALNVHAGHDDVMSVADCGWGMLFARNAQEVADLALISRRTAEESFTPFLCIQDGFLTSHTVENAYLPEQELIKTYLKPPAEVIPNLMNPENPVTSGTLQNQDAYMRGKIGQREFYVPLKDNLKSAMEEYYKLTGRKYDLIDLYEMEDAEYAIVGMGTFMETAKATVDWLRKNKGEKVGVVSVLSYRPFPGHELVEALSGLKGISILERLDESGSPENPLARGIKAAFADAMWGCGDHPQIKSVPVIQHGAGGLGGNDVRVRDLIAVVENMKLGKKGKTNYCLGVEHEDALAFVGEEPDARDEGSFSMRGYSIGGFGSMTTNKVIASVCADLFDLKVQANPKYGAEKKGLPTQYFLTTAPNHIRTHQELEKVEFVAFNHMGSFLSGNPLAGLVEGGTVFLQVSTKDPKEIWDLIPSNGKEAIIKNKYKVFALDSAGIAKEVAKAPHLVVRMQGIILLGLFLRVTPFAEEQGMDEKKLFEKVEDVIRKSFGKYGESVVEENLTCIKRGYKELIEIPESVKKG